MKRALIAVAILVAAGGCTTANAEPQTPPCLDALDAADKTISLAGEAFGYTSDAMTAVSELDTAGVEAAGQKIHDLTPKVADASDAYRTARDECRGEGS